MAKYGNKKVKYNNIVFDSKKEALRYKELLLMQKAGMITDLQLQVEFELLPVQKQEVLIKGKKKTKVIERAVKYIADFVYKENGNLIVEDTKGIKTKDYILKRKMMLFFHNIKIKEI